MVLLYINTDTYMQNIYYIDIKYVSISVTGALRRPIPLLEKLPVVLGITLLSALTELLPGGERLVA